MDRTSSALAAFRAGKLPSQQQTSRAVDALLNAPVLSNEPSKDAGQLSEEGVKLQNDLRQLLTAYKAFGESKNGDNIIQQALWHLSQADISDASTTASPSGATTDEASADARNLARALRTLFSVVWSSLASESRELLHDFASFARLSLADVAESVAGTAQSTAESLRQLDEDVAKGVRTEIGTKRKAEDDPADADARVKFERTMDTTKDVGSRAIGAGQAAAATAQDLSERSTARLQDTFYTICDRAQGDENYRQAVDTVFDLVEKWAHRSLDAAGDVNQATDLDSFIDDPTPEKHLIKAIRGFRAFVERLSGGDTSLDGFFAALRTCGADIQRDPDVRNWFDGFVAYLRKSVNEKGYVRSEDAKTRRRELRAEWKELTDKDGEKGRSWKDDVAQLRDEFNSFQVAVRRDKELGAVRRAHTQLGTDLEESLITAGGVGLQNLMEKAPWFYQDIFNVYVPKVMAAIRDIPIPRTEYKDDDMELVLEDLDISTFSVLPGHAYIRNITDIDITAPAVGAPASTAVGSLTRVFLQGVQIALRDVSFFFRDKTSTSALAPSEFTGRLAFTLPPQGIDLDIVVRTIPNSPEGLAERQRRGGFVDIQRVDVKVSEDIDVSISESNHSVLATLFRPAMRSRVREALRSTLEGYVRGALEGADALAWDVSGRKEVFEDTGLGSGASFAAAVWSELGRMQRGESTWSAFGTGTGVIVRSGDGRAHFAMGAEPQVLSGEKRGPSGNFSDSVAERMDVDVDAEGNVEGAKALAEQATETVKEGVRKVKGFADSVKEKTEQEKSRPGWESHAFDWE